MEVIKSFAVLESATNTLGRNQERTGLVRSGMECFPLPNQSIQVNGGNKVGNLSLTSKQSTESKFCALSEIKPAVNMKIRC